MSFVSFRIWMSTLTFTRLLKHPYFYLSTECHYFWHLWLKQKEEEKRKRDYSSSSFLRQSMGQSCPDIDAMFRDELKVESGVRLATGQHFFWPARVVLLKDGINGHHWSAGNERRVHKYEDAGKSRKLDFDKKINRHLNLKKLKF